MVICSIATLITSYSTLKSQKIKCERLHRQSPISIGNNGKDIENKQ